MPLRKTQGGCCAKQDADSQRRQPHFGL
jgi:hypothetical protein